MKLKEEDISIVDDNFLNFWEVSQKIQKDDLEMYKTYKLFEYKKRIRNRMRTRLQMLRTRRLP